MIGKERAVSFTELRNMVNEAVEEKVNPLAERVKELSSSFESQREQRSKGDANMAKYKCRGKGCHFETEDIVDLVEHSVGEQLQPIHDQLATLSKPVEPATGATAPPAPKRQHEAAAEFLDCPECASKFEAELLKRGWKKPEPTKKKETLF